MQNFLNKKRWFVKIATTLFMFLIVFMPLVVVAQNPPAPNSVPKGVPIDTLPLDIRPQQGPPPPGAPSDYCSGVLFFDVSCILAHIFSFIINIGSLLVWLGGKLMDFAIVFSIIDFQNEITNNDGIRQAWGILRDFANMFFIFMLLYASISMILGKNSKSIVVNVIISAFLINFSFFFTGLMIDASNTITVGIYNQILSNSGGATSISSAFMNSLGLQSVLSIDLSKSISEGGSGFETIAKAGAMGIIFFITTAFVFFASAILFIIRSAILGFLLILSPLAFAAKGLPKDEISGKWWKALMSNLIFAPMYMIMIYISLKITGSIISSNKKGIGGSVDNLAAAIAGEDGSLRGVFNFVIIIIMMVASLLIAKEVGAYGAKTMNSWGASLRKGAQGLVGRNTVGRGAALVDQFMNKDTRFGNTFIGSGLRNYTTGALMKQKFGSGSSFEDENNKTEKRRESYAKVVLKENNAAAEKAQEDLEKAQARQALLEVELEEKEKKKKDHEESVYKKDTDVIKAEKDLTDAINKLTEQEKLIKEKEEELGKTPMATKAHDLLKRELQTLNTNKIPILNKKIKKEKELKTAKENALKKQGPQPILGQTNTQRQAGLDRDISDVKEKITKAKANVSKIQEENKLLLDKKEQKTRLAAEAGRIEDSTHGINPLNRWFSSNRKEAAKALRKASKGKSIDDKARDLLKEMEKKKKEEEGKGDEEEADNRPKKDGATN